METNAVLGQLKMFQSTPPSKGRDTLIEPEFADAFMQFQSTPPSKGRDTSPRRSARRPRRRFNPRRPRRAATRIGRALKSFLAMRFQSTPPSKGRDTPSSPSSPPCRGSRFNPRRPRRAATRPPPTTARRATGCFNPTPPSKGRDTSSAVTFGTSYTRFNPRRPRRAATRGPGRRRRRPCARFKSHAALEGPQHTRDQRQVRLVVHVSIHAALEGPRHPRCSISHGRPSGRFNPRRPSKGRDTHVQGSPAMPALQRFNPPRRPRRAATRGHIAQKGAHGI